MKSNRLDIFKQYWLIIILAILLIPVITIVLCIPKINFMQYLIICLCASFFHSALNYLVKVSVLTNKRNVILQRIFFGLWMLITSCGIWLCPHILSAFMQGTFIYYFCLTFYHNQSPLFS